MGETIKTLTSFENKTDTKATFEVQKQDVEKLLKIQNESARFFFYYWKFKEEHPNIYLNMISRHPSLLMHISYMENILDKISSKNDNLSEEDIKAFALQYNFSADRINYVLKTFNIRSIEFIDKTAENFIKNEIEITNEQRYELRQFAKDLFKEIFPDWYVTKAVKDFNSQEELEDYQKILLAPANGVEYMIFAVLSLLKKETYTDFYKSADFLMWLDLKEKEKLYSLLSVLNDNISNVDKISIIISLIYWLFAIKWAVSVINIINKSKISKWTSKILLAFSWIAVKTKAVADMSILWWMMTTRFDEDWINI